MVRGQTLGIRCGLQARRAWPDAALSSGISNSSAAGDQTWSRGTSQKRSWIQQPAQLREPQERQLQELVELAVHKVLKGRSDANTKDADLEEEVELVARQRRTSQVRWVSLRVFRTESR